MTGIPPYLLLLKFHFLKLFLISFLVAHLELPCSKLPSSFGSSFFLLNTNFKSLSNFKINKNSIKESNIVPISKLKSLNVISDFIILIDQYNSNLFLIIFVKL